MIVDIAEIIDSIEKAGWEIKINGEVTHVSSDPKLRDTDLDGLDDFEEFNGGTLVLSDTKTLIIKTNPQNADTDSDGIDDNIELAGLYSGSCPESAFIYDPSSSDYDSDKVIDSVESEHCTEPIHPDTDLDGLKDADELSYGTNPLSKDSDSDGLSDGDEISLGLSPIDRDSDNDAWPDSSDPYPLQLMWPIWAPVMTATIIVIAGIFTLRLALRRRANILKTRAIEYEDFVKSMAEITHGYIDVHTILEQINLNYAQGHLNPRQARNYLTA